MVAPSVNIGVSVLNYMDYRSTQECVDSLLACQPPPSYIVVVDNASPNESFANLLDRFSSCAVVEVIQAERNGGFSFGHNIGVHRLRQLGLDNVVLATPDTRVLTCDLFARLEDAVAGDIGIVGPRIKTLSELDQNPSVFRLTVRYWCALLWFQYGRPGRKSWSLIRHRFLTKANLPIEDKFRENRLRVYKLHGSFFMLTRSYLQCFHELDEDLFMFGEEDLLAWNCRKVGLSALLLLDAEVSHSNDSSITAAHGSDSSKFICDTEAASARVLRKRLPMMKILKEALKSR